MTICYSEGVLGVAIRWHTGKFQHMSRLSAYRCFYVSFHWRGAKTAFLRDLRDIKQLQTERLTSFAEMSDLAIRRIIPARRRAKRAYREYKL